MDARGSILGRVILGLGALSGGCFLAGCILPVPTIPAGAPGYGHTYAVLDDHGRPVPSGLLILTSEYEVWPTPPDMYGCFEIREGKVRVPWRIGTRTACAGALIIPVINIRSANPNHTIVVPLVPGYVGVCGYWSDWDEHYKLDGTITPDVIRVFKADRKTEVYYLDVLFLDVLFGWCLKERRTLTAGGYGGYAEKDRRRDQKAFDRAWEYARNRMAELGYEPNFPGPATRSAPASAPAGAPAERGRKTP